MAEERTKYSREFKITAVELSIARGQVRELSEAWRNDYNNYHPHKSLLGMSPKQFKNRKMNYG